MTIHEEIQQMVFRLSYLKTQAKTSEEYEQANAALNALLRVNWAALCKGGGLFSQKMEMKSKEAA